MKSSCKTPVPALVRMVLAAICALPAMFSLYGCAPKSVPLGVTLDTPEHHVLSGMKFIDLGRFEDALREFDLTKRHDPTFSKAYVGCALVFAYQDHWDEAFRELEKGKALAGADEEKVFADVVAVRLFVVGKESAAKDWLAAAESAYHDAVTRMPDVSQAHFYMGMAYEEVGDLAKASVLYKKVLHLDKTHLREARAALDRIKRLKGNQL